MFYIGIDLGGTNIAAALVDENGAMSGKVSVPTRANEGTQAVLDGLVKVVGMVLETAKVQPDEVEAVGIGAPGMMNPETGVVHFSPNLPLAGVNIASDIKSKYGLPVHINNDANCASLGEVAFGGAKNTNNAIFVTIGTGLGGGIVIDGKVYSGFNGAAGEIGHIGLVPNGRQCGCGRRGCWEAYASATGLVKTTREAMLEDKGSVMWTLCGGDINRAGGRTAFEAQREGDPAGDRTVKTYIGHLASGIIDMINIFQPEVVCIGGGVSHEGEYLMAPLREAVNVETYTSKSDAVPQTRITAAKLGNDAGIVGAAILGR